MIVHEAGGENTAIRQRRPVPADPQDDNRQGGGRTARGRRHGDAQLVRRDQRGRLAGGAGGGAGGDRISRRLNSQLAPGILVVSKGGLTCCSRTVSLSPTFSPTSCRSLSSCCGSGC